MVIDPYAVLHALLRAEAARSTKSRPEPEPEQEHEAGDGPRPSAPPEKDSE
jgi:hypothetical protein